MPANPLPRSPATPPLSLRLSRTRNVSFEIGRLSDPFSQPPPGKPIVNPFGDHAPTQFKHHVVTHVWNEDCFGVVALAVAATSPWVNAPSSAPPRTSNGVETSSGRIRRRLIICFIAKALSGCNLAVQPPTIYCGVWLQKSCARAKRGVLTTS
jgi:hypothetical protein